MDYRRTGHQWSGIWILHLCGQVNRLLRHSEQLSARCICGNCDYMYYANAGITLYNVENGGVGNELIPTFVSGYYYMIHLEMLFKENNVTNNDRNIPRRFRF